MPNIKNNSPLEVLNYFNDTIIISVPVFWPFAFFKRHFSFLEFIMEEKLLRRTANLTTFFASGLIFIYFETSKNKFHSSFEFVINIYICI